jgi:hypothetical protein
MEIACKHIESLQEPAHHKNMLEELCNKKKDNGQYTPLVCKEIYRDEIEENDSVLRNSFSYKKFNSLNY